MMEKNMETTLMGNIGTFRVQFSGCLYSALKGAAHPKF